VFLNFGPQEFDSRRANQWKTLRQDSGDPKAFAPRAKQMYEERGIDHTKKGIIYSDALDFNKAKALHDQCQQLGFTKCTLSLFAHDRVSHFHPRRLLWHRHLADKRLQDEEQRVQGTKQSTKHGNQAWIS
jgi:hypothetical protein